MPQVIRFFLLKIPTISPESYIFPHDYRWCCLIHGCNYSYGPTLFVEYPKYFSPPYLSIPPPIIFTPNLPKRTVCISVIFFSPIQSISHPILLFPENISPPVYSSSAFVWDGVPPGSSNAVIYQIGPVLNLGKSVVLESII